MQWLHKSNLRKGGGFLKSHKETIEVKRGEGIIVSQIFSQLNVILFFKKIIEDGGSNVSRYISRHSKDTQQRLWLRRQNWHRLSKLFVRWRSEEYEVRREVWNIQTTVYKQNKVIPSEFIRPRHHVKVRKWNNHHHHHNRPRSLSTMDDHLLATATGGPQEGR